MSLLRVVEPIGQRYPGGRVFAFIAEVGRQVGPWHEVKEIELHSVSSFDQRLKPDNTYDLLLKGDLLGCFKTCRRQMCDHIGIRRRSPPSLRSQPARTQTSRGDLPSNEHYLLAPIPLPIELQPHSPPTLASLPVPAARTGGAPV